MDDYRKSNYAINKALKGIVYRNNDGSILEVTFEKIAAENPSFTAEDFKKLKELSDELYHEEAKNDCNYHYHITSDLNENFDSEWLATLALEDELMETEAKKQFRIKLQNAMDTVLTPVQKRRFIMYFIEGMTLKEIAAKEKCSLNVVWKSICIAREEIVNFL
ncbi:MAG: hypothetical protein LUG52_03035 [Clostridia bacterium]|nr:hypothetical protein [Clostridia bacterium]